MLGLLLSPAFATTQKTPTVLPACATQTQPIETIRTLRDIGAYQPLTLRGVDGSMSLNFGTRLDEIVNRAQLHLDYTLSPALLPTLSQLNVYLNDEIIATLPVTKDSQNGKQSADITIDPRFFSDFNTLRFQLIGHYTNECEFPYHTSLWANISNLSRLTIDAEPVALRDDLSLLPAPFFDRHDTRRLELPFIFAAHPSLATIRAAGSTASWFGALAGYRGARFPVALNRLPARYGVVFATNDERPDFLTTIGKIDAPTLAVIRNPANPAGALLLVLGRNAADLKVAADALALGKTVLSGTRVTVDALVYPPQRKAYDAPNWLPTDHPVRFGELVAHPGDLQRRGQYLSPVLINARLPADLFLWRNPGMPINLKYRFTPAADSTGANLNMEINDQFVGSLVLPSQRNYQAKSSLILPIMSDQSVQQEGAFVVPAFELGSDNQMRFTFFIPPANRGQCASVPQSDLFASIDPDSTLDISQFYHYTALPNLAFFANSGYPFTKFADLSHTSIVLPGHPDAADMETLFTVLGLTGRSTGYPALDVHLIRPDEADKADKDDLLIIDSGSGNALLKRWHKSLPAMLSPAERSLTLSGKAMRMAYDWFGIDEPFDTSSGGKLHIQSKGPLGIISGFESPLSTSHSAVAIVANQPDAVNLLTDALTDAGKVRQIRGDLSIVSPTGVESFRVSDDFYYVGHLPWWLWLWFHLSHHPILLTLLGIASGLLLALIIFGLLRKHAARRLKSRS